MEHKELLERLALINHDNGRKFKDTSKLDEIRKVLSENSPYHELYPGKVCSVWARMDNLPKEVIVMSTHIDTVKSIRNPFSELVREEEDGKENDFGVYKGTYDNLATNAAYCALMMEEDIPDNVVFTFDGDEETGCCHGLKEAVKWLKSGGHEIIYGIAADVTYEGFYENKLASYENMTGKKDDLEKMFSMFRATEPEGEKTFSFVPLSKDMVPESGKDYFKGSTGMLDEAFTFKDLGIPGLSICVPTRGSMHSDSGLQMKEAVFEGYILNLATAVYALTNTHQGTIEAYKFAKSRLKEEAARTELPREEYRSYTGYGYRGIPGYDLEPSDYMYGGYWRSEGDREYLVEYDDEDFDEDDDRFWSDRELTEEELMELEEIQNWNASFGYMDKEGSDWDIPQEVYEKWNDNWEEKGYDEEDLVETENEVLPWEKEDDEEDFEEDEEEGVEKD